MTVSKRAGLKAKMKYMKLGTRPDSFYTVEATRSMSSDVPSDLTIQINNITYLLHKFPLLPKCGLLQRLCDDSEEGPVKLHNIPGGAEAFELCSKFCYGITITLSAYNFVPAICAAKFLRMTESTERGNFVLKLDTFFNSCILQGWKDSIVTLQSTTKFPEWSENLGIVGRCIESIVEKILTPLSKVTWSYTYTRPGYAQRSHRSVPKDWWTEDISDLDIELFRSVITAVRSTKQLPDALIGEALHVYASRWLPSSSNGWAAETSVERTDDSKNKHRRILESIVSLFPSDRRSVSGGFLLRLLKVANLVGSSPSTKAELIKRSGRQLDEATVNDLLVPSYSTSEPHFYDVDLVGTVLEHFLILFSRNSSMENGDSIRSIYKVAKLIDQYLQVVARDANIPASKIAALAESVPEYARPQHDELYKAIDIFLKEHPDLSKPEKKRLCRVLDCRKLSNAACMHAVRNERLPLRTLVQVLFLEQTRIGSGMGTPRPMPETIREEPIEAYKESTGKSKVATHSHRERENGRVNKPDKKPVMEIESKLAKKVREMEKVREIIEEEDPGSKLELKSRRKPSNGR
ncbi:BTB/POZ domain-containing protein At5g47800-like [Aristolochia californica]|uniref:BTB/POZ domain-containing protein At5g47800-like n=1 Tax=Aristolochia californica TaxID=171875 RepID=UPI0035D880F0